MSDSITYQTQPGVDPSVAPAGSTAETTDGVTKATASSQPSSQPAENQPKKLAGKFDSPEALEQAYIELQKKLGAPNVAPKETPKVPTIEVPSDAEKAVQAAGLDLDALSDEFSTTGALSAESMAKLAASGVTKEAVEKYVQGAIDTAQRHFTEVAGVAGGAEQLNQVLSWAAANAQPEAVQAYNDAVATKNLGVVKLAVQALTAAYTRENGTPPQRITGETVPNATDSVQAFGSSFELTQAMRDPRYAQDPAYRDAVYKRLAKTQMFGA